MADPPRVSVITPTWQRADLLLGRCVPAVQAQTYPNVEHVIVSDGDEFDDIYHRLLNREQDRHPVSYGWLPEHAAHKHWGNLARLRALQLASGDLICYCDDDDALRPRHAEVLATALEADPSAGWAFSRMVSHRPAGETVIGDYNGPPVFGTIGTPMIMHRRGLLNIATWGADGAGEDWDLVNCWLQAGVPYVRVAEETVDVWPSQYWASA
jgi:glycosyltransferase involved in cell wall biosynthesis